MDPRPGRAIHDSCKRMGDLLTANGLKVFTIETTVNNDTFPDPFGFMNKREWEWSLLEQGTYLAAKKANDLGPSAAKHQIWTRIKSPYGVTGINAGETEAVHERTLETLHRQQLVEVNGQSDVMVVGIPYLTPYNVNSILNPILVHCMGLGYLFNMYRNKPVVRPGGAMIMFHPVPNEFHQVHHPPTSTSSRRSCPRRPIPPRSSRSTRSATRPTPGTSTSTARATRTTASTLLHVVLGRADWTTSAT